jgi:hypothetical protein
MRRAFFAVAPLFAFAVFASCAARINGPLKPDGSAELIIRASLEPHMAALIRGLSAMGGAPAADGPLLDGPAIAQSMSAAPGIDSVSFKNTGSAAIEGPVKVSQIGDFLSPGGGPGGRGFISFTQNGAGGGSCVIALSRETGPEALALLSPEITGYLSALMAPLVTGEALSKIEYLALAGTVYGKGVTDEIAKSRILASIDFPGPVRSIKGGTFSGRRAEFDIPLLDLLVLETPLNYEVAWR